MIRVREKEKWPVKFCGITIAEGRIRGGGQMRNPPSFGNNPTKSQAVRSEVEAVQQQRADDDQ